MVQLPETIQMGYRDVALARKRGHHRPLGGRKADGFRCRCGWTCKKVPMLLSVFSMTHDLRSSLTGREAEGR